VACHRDGRHLPPSKFQNFQKLTQNSYFFSFKHEYNNKNTNQTLNPKVTPKENLDLYIIII
jgi:hypothetical protein